MVAGFRRLRMWTTRADFRGTDYFLDMKKYLAVAVVIVLNCLTPVTAQAACTSSKASGSIKVGSSISGGSVVVCASTSSAATSTAVKKTTTTIKKVTSIKVVKPAPPPCIIKVTSNAAINDPRVPGCSYLVVAPTKSITTLPKSTATTTSSLTTQNDQAAFTPNPVGISQSASSGVVGQAFFFGAIAGAHTRSATILGKAAQVSFTPVSYDWSSDEGESGCGGSFSASWGSEGSHSVSLTVGYSVSYTIGDGWIDAGQISSSASAGVVVSATQIVPVTKSAPPLLVSGNCTVRPGTYGC